MIKLIILTIILLINGVTSKKLVTVSNFEAIDDGDTSTSRGSTRFGCLTEELKRCR